MAALTSLTDSQLVTRLNGFVRAERQSTADVIEHLVEVERRRLYLRHRVSSLYGYCIKQLGYDEDAALKRHRVAKLAARLPQVLDELRAGTMHLTGLFLLASHLTEDNAPALLDDARGKTRRKIEQLIACWFPRADVPASIEPLPANASVATTCSGAGKGPARLEPLSPTRVRVEFTARAELYDKLEKARDLLSHAVPSGDLGDSSGRSMRCSSKRRESALVRRSRENYASSSQARVTSPSAFDARFGSAMTRNARTWTPRDGAAARGAF